MPTKSLRFPSTRRLIHLPGYAQEDGFNIALSRVNGTSAGLTPISVNAYTAANQPQVDTIEVVSADAGDTTQTITHVGIDALGNRIEETVSLNGATAVATTQNFTYWEYSVLSAVTAGNVTIREGSANQTITTIVAGVLHTEVAHIFSGENQLFITGFSADIDSIAGNVTFTLLQYAAASCVALTGSKQLDKICVFDTEGVAPAPRVYWPAAIYVAPGQYVAVKSVGEGGDDEDFSINLNGFVIPKPQLPTPF